MGRHASGCAARERLSGSSAALALQIGQRFRAQIVAHIPRVFLAPSYSLLPRAEFSRFVLEYRVFANGYLEQRTNRPGDPRAPTAPLAKYMRAGIDPVLS